MHFCPAILCDQTSQNAKFFRFTNMKLGLCI